MSTTNELAALQEMLARLEGEETAALAAFVQAREAHEALPRWNGSLPIPAMLVAATRAEYLAARQARRALYKAERARRQLERFRSSVSGKPDRRRTLQ